MRGKTRKFIARKIREKDESLIMTIREQLGKPSTLFTTNQVYKWSKRLWNRGPLKKALGKGK